MLVEFRVKNFRSLRDDLEFRFYSSTDKTFQETHCIDTGHKSIPFVNRSAVMYGGNATGKSNLMFALASMRQLVLHSNVLADNQLSELYTPFRLAAETMREPTEFEITVILDGLRYQYGFAYDAQMIRNEWLIVYQHAKGQHWFERSNDSIDGTQHWEPFSAYFTGPKSTWMKATRRRALFLTTAVQLNSEQLQPLFDWFENGITLLTGRGDLDPRPTLRKIESAGHKSRILDLLRAADIHVADVKVEKKQGQQFQFKLEPGGASEITTTEAEVPEVQFLHKVKGGESAWFDQRYESAGTQRLFAYAGPLLDAIEYGKLLVIDELDRSLHPLLARFVLNLMHDPKISQRGAQLWITTHDTTLLDTQLLRRDQIWFVEKDQEQATQLYPLSDFKPRKNDVLERGYLMGRYGGIPFIRESRLGIPQ